MKRIPRNKQVEKTKTWQTKYFIDVTSIDNIDQGNLIR